VEGNVDWAGDSALFSSRASPVSSLGGWVLCQEAPGFSPPFHLNRLPTLGGRRGGDLGGGSDGDEEGNAGGDSNGGRRRALGVAEDVPPQAALPAS